MFQESVYNHRRVVSSLHTLRTYQTSKIHFHLTTASQLFIKLKEQFDILGNHRFYTSECVSRCLTKERNVWDKTDDLSGSAASIWILFSNFQLLRSEMLNECMTLAKAYSDVWDNSVRSALLSTVCVCPFPNFTKPTRTNQLHKELVFPVWCGKIWLACTEPWPQPHPTQVRPDHPTSVSDLTDALVSEWDQVPAAGSISGGKTKTRRVEAVTAAH